MSRRRTVALLALAAVLVAVGVVRQLVVSPERVASASMSPTLDAGDVVLVSRHRPSVTDLERGEVVTLRPPGDDALALKRVVGLPGETLVVLDGRLVVDGTPVPEPYVDPATVSGYYTATFRVPADSVFVMGDNRANSVDSRDYGPVPLDRLEGRLLVRLY